MRPRGLAHPGARSTRNSAKWARRGPTSCSSAKRALAAISRTRFAEVKSGSIRNSPTITATLEEKGSCQIAPKSDIEALIIGHLATCCLGRARPGESYEDSERREQC